MVQCEQARIQGVAMGVLKNISFLPTYKILADPTHSVAHRNDNS